MYQQLHKTIFSPENESTPKLTKIPEIIFEGCMLVAKTNNLGFSSVLALKLSAFLLF
jgi:hypothetical protein